MSLAASALVFFHLIRIVHYRPLLFGHHSIILRFLLRPALLQTFHLPRLHLGQILAAKMDAAVLVTHLVAFYILDLLRLWT